MATLHIEHGITDYATWKTAFDRFSEKRSQAGVSGVRILQPIDDPGWIVLQLDFPDQGAAERFKVFLESQVWTNPERSPGLNGVPRARVLIEPNRG